MCLLFMEKVCGLSFQHALFGVFAKCIRIPKVSLILDSNYEPPYSAQCSVESKIMLHALQKLGMPALLNFKLKTSAVSSGSIRLK